MIDQVFFDPDFFRESRYWVRKKFGEYRVFIEKQLQAFFLYPECGNGCNCGRSGAIDGCACSSIPRP